MKDITTYINEVSKGLAQRAYNKATGAQKNRIKKLLGMMQKNQMYQILNLTFLMMLKMEIYFQKKI